MTPNDVTEELVGGIQDQFDIEIPTPSRGAQCRRMLESNWESPIDDREHHTVPGKPCCC